MALDFPNSPVVGDVFNGDGVSWRWDGVKWVSILSTGGPFLPLTGGTISPGPLVMPNMPISSTGLAPGTFWLNGGFVCVA